MSAPITGTTADGAAIVSVNSEPLIVGNLMLLSDQDMTALKHSFLDQVLISSVFTALLAWIASSHVAYLLKVAVMVGMIFGLKVVTTMITNIVIVMIETHPSCHPTVWLPIMLHACRHGFIVCLAGLVHVHVHVKRIMRRAGDGFMRGLVFMALGNGSMAAMDADAIQDAIDYALGHDMAAAGDQWPPVRVKQSATADEPVAASNTVSA